MKTTDNKQQTMEQLEEKLLSRFGTERPFTVPDGYFESLTDRVMSRIAQRKRRRLVWRWAAAAMPRSAAAAGTGRCLPPPAARPARPGPPGSGGSAAPAATGPPQRPAP